MKTIQATEEQLAIVEESEKGTDVILVNAFAGTGKTTTCFLVIEKLIKKGKRILYLVFNKSAAEDAKKKAKNLGLLQKNLEISTVHAYAYKRLKKANQLKGKNFGALKVKTVADKFHKIFNYSKKDYNKIFWVVEFFNHFLYSKFNWDEIEDFITYKIEKSKKFRTGYDLLGEEFLITSIKHLILLINEGLIEMPHDFYLKKYVFSDLINEPYDLVILDESQDANPLFIEFLKKLKTKQILLVGDKHQRIYQFRNTIDAFNYYKEGKIFYLTQSFRFTEDIAEKANLILNFKGEIQKLRGVKEPNHKFKNIAFIGYTNSAILQKYLTLSPKEKDYAMFERPIEEILKPILTICVFREKKNPSDLKLPIDYSLINSFQNYQDLEFYIKEIENLYINKNDKKEEEEENFLSEKELLQAYILSKQFNVEEIENLYRQYKNAEHNEKHIYLSTAHAAKGLEYNEVYLLKDLAIQKKFLEHFLNQYSQNIEADLNLLYVAVTRASKKIDYGFDLIETFNNIKMLSEEKKEQQQGLFPIIEMKENKSLSEKLKRKI